MLSSLKAEIRKIFTVRSTYIMLVIVLALMFFVSFYVVGWRAKSSDLLNPNNLSNNISGAVNTLIIFAGFISILMVTHEYRYNTIMYALTNTNRRAKVFYSKILVTTAFAIIFTLAITVLVPLFMSWGIRAHGLHQVHQVFYFRDILWRTLFFGWGYVMAAVVLALIIRNQIATIVTLLYTGLVDYLLSLILKKNIAYLPFDALSNVLGNGGNIANSQNSITPFHSLLVVMAYLVIGGIVSWVLFVRRDAVTNST